MADIKVSVIIPVYNTEEYVADALQSVLQQTLREIEIIVINDGSTDGSFRIVKSIAGTDSRIRLYEQENRGLSETRNRGLSMAKGDYIYFMDSDDLLDENTLLECYEKCRLLDLDFVFFDADVFGESVRRFDVNYHRTHLIKDSVYSGVSMLEHFFKVGGYQPSACLSVIKLSFLKRIALTFYPGIIHEDELFTFQLYLKAERVACRHQAYFKRRLRSNSIMVNQFSRRNLDGYLTVISELVKLKRREKDERVGSLVDTRLNEILNGIIHNSRSMRAADRLFLLVTCLFHYRRYASAKSLIVLSFPLLSSLKRRILRRSLSNA